LLKQSPKAIPAMTESIFDQRSYPTL